MNWLSVISSLMIKDSRECRSFPIRQLLFFIAITLLWNLTNFNRNDWLEVRERRPRCTREVYLSWSKKTLSVSHIEILAAFPILMKSEVTWVHQWNICQKVFFSSSFKLRPPGNQVFKVTAKSVQKHIYMLSLAFSATNNIYTKGFQCHSRSPSIHSCSFALKARSDGYKVK